MKSNSKLLHRAISLLGICGLMLGSITVAKATITVTSLNDSGPGSLRQAIADAAPGDTIDFAVTGTIGLTGGELIVDKDLTISGPGAMNLAISGNNALRVFNVGTNVNGIVTMPDLIVTISGLMLANGRAYDGGGVRNVGNLTIANCTISNANSPYGIDFGYGGGIASVGVLVVTNCTVMNCSSSVGGGICDAVGASDTSPDSRITIVNSTFSGNSAYQGTAINNFRSQATIVNSTFSGNIGGYAGAAIMNQGSISVSNCTLFGNTSGRWGAAIGNLSYGAYGVIRNSIVAGNSAIGVSSDIYSFGYTVNSQDYNLIQNTSGATITGVTTHNIYGKDPLLGPLADNGGPTLTHALLPGSPAIDHGSSGGLTTDQRGQPRPVRFPAYLAAADGSDIGAYELQERVQTNWVVNGSSSNLVFIVNSTNDVDDGVPGIAHCSLREAINAVNANPGTNTTAINFATNVPGISTGVTGTITLTNGQLTITNSVNINGPGAANLTVSGNNASRVLEFDNVTSSISGLTIANGQASGASGGGILNSGDLTINNCNISSNNAFAGGGIAHSARNLTAFNTTFFGNTASGGGGINTAAITRLLGCTLSGNYASPGIGGAVLDNAGYCWFTNTTISGNSAPLNDGGGIWTQPRLNAPVFESCTICSNVADRAGGIYIALPDTVMIRNSIVAGNSASGGVAPDFWGNLVSLDYNLIQNTNSAAGGITGATAHNLYNQDPKLGPLAYLGGPTPTHPLRYDSPALNAGNSGGLTTDQRGFPRPLGTAAVSGGDGSDIGAYEADPILRLTAIAMAGNDILVNFTSVFGRNYQIYSANNLAGSWTMVTNNVAGSGGVMQSVDAGGAGQTQRFYRAAQQ